MPGIFMASLGCVKNLVDAETFLGETLDDEFTLVLDPADADVILVNTCGFIEDARAESRDAIAEYLELARRSGRDIRVVATGCLAERSPDDLLRDYPELAAVWGLAAPSSLRDTLRGVLAGKGGKAWQGKRPAPREGARLLSTPPSFAYLRIADGCDNRCHYCAIPLIRGGMHSRPTDALLEEARLLEAGGAKELILIAQDITAYGRDYPGVFPSLAGLLERLLATVAVPRLRLLYAHPAHIEDEVVRLLASEPRLCRYLDLPLQHISDRMLAAMGRGYDRARAMRLLERLREGGVTVRTTLLTGFPGEGEEDFRAALELVRGGWFRHLGAFAYSREEGTPAATLSGEVPAETAAARRDALLETQSRVAFAWLDSRVGGTEEVLLDSHAGDGWLAGRTASEAPDADGAVFVRAPKARPGDILEACITAREGYDLVAETRSAPHRRRRGK